MKGIRSAGSGRFCHLKPATPAATLLLAGTAPSGWPAPSSLSPQPLETTLHTSTTSATHPQARTYAYLMQRRRWGVMAFSCVWFVCRGDKQPATACTARSSSACPAQAALQRSWLPGLTAPAGGAPSPAPPAGDEHSGWYYDVDKVGGSFGIFYGYVGIIGLALYLVLRWFKAGVSLAAVWCIYGERLGCGAMGGCRGRGRGWLGLSGYMPAPACRRLMPLLSTLPHSCQCCSSVSLMPQ